MIEKDDLKIVQALIERDEQVTQRFFFKDCRPLFLTIIRHVFSFDVDYDEFVNEFYLYLMENDAYKLRQFQGRSTIFQWLKVIAIRYFMAKRDLMIDNCSKDSFLENGQRQIMNDEESIMSRMDIANILKMMPNKRYVYVIQKLLLEEIEPKKIAEELDVSIDNLYNIKKRAIASMTQVALNEMKNYERKICKQ